MFRMGDRFTWTDSGQTKRFALLAGDYVFSDNGYGIGSHPDVDHVWQNEVFDGEPARWGGTDAVGYTTSWWIGGMNRGGLDMNFAFEDGSVRCYRGVAFQDERFAETPPFSNGVQWPARKNHMPAEGG